VLSVISIFTVAANMVFNKVTHDLFVKNYISSYFNKQHRKVINRKKTKVYEILIIFLFWDASFF
jgi:hypothetical protein